MTTINMKNEFIPSGSYVDLTNESGNLGEMWYLYSDPWGPLDPVLPVNHGGMVLVVHFQKGGYYAYGGVVPPLWEFILDGKTAKGDGRPFSIGAAFHEEVIRKKDLYPYVRLSNEQVKELLG